MFSSLLIISTRDTFKNLRKTNFQNGWRIWGTKILSVSEGHVPQWSDIYVGCRYIIRRAVVQNGLGTIQNHYAASEQGAKFTLLLSLNIQLEVVDHAQSMRGTEIRLNNNSSALMNKSNSIKTYCLMMDSIVVYNSLNLLLTLDVMRQIGQNSLLEN